MEVKKGSICLTDLIEEAKKGNKAFTKAKNGKTYFKFVIFENKEPDQYNKIGSVAISKDKDSNDKTIYIGNLDAPFNPDIQQNQKANMFQAGQNFEQETINNSEIDNDFPF